MGNETGHPERTYLVDMNGNEKPPTPEGIVARAATTDGKNLIVSNLDSTQFQLLPVDGGQPRPLPQLQKGDTPQDFTPDDKAILLRRSGKTQRSKSGGWSWRQPSGRRSTNNRDDLPDKSNARLDYPIDLREAVAI